MIDQEPMELQEIYNDGGDASEIFHFQVCLVFISSIYTGCFAYGVPSRKFCYFIYLHHVLY